jgi:hypothetical protein
MGSHGWFLYPGLTVITLKKMISSFKMKCNAEITILNKSWRIAFLSSKLVNDFWAFGLFFMLTPVGFYAVCKKDLSDMQCSTIQLSI